MQQSEAKPAPSKTRAIKVNLIIFLAYTLLIFIAMHDPENNIATVLFLFFAVSLHVGLNLLLGIIALFRRKPVVPYFFSSLLTLVLGLLVGNGFCYFL